MSPRRITLTHIKQQEKCVNERNPVAKNMNKFNKAATHRDRKNDYTRKPKHPKGRHE